MQIILSLCSLEKEARGWTCPEASLLAPSFRPWPLFMPQQTGPVSVRRSLLLVTGAGGKLVRSGEIPATTAASTPRADPCHLVWSPLWQISSLVAFSWGACRFPSSTLWGNLKLWERSVHSWTPKVSQAQVLILTAPELYVNQAQSFHVPKHSMTVSRTLCPQHVGPCG